MLKDKGKVESRLGAASGARPKAVIAAKLLVHGHVATHFGRALLGQLSLHAWHCQGEVFLFLMPQNPLAKG